jgi:AbiU2
MSKLANFHWTRKNGSQVPLIIWKRILMLISREKFKEQLKAIIDNLWMAHFYYDLSTKLTNSFTEYREEVRQSPVFWNLTISALDEVSLVRLCRVYDQHKDSQSLKNLLITIKKNPEIFSQNRTSYISEPQYPKAFNQNELDKYIEFVSKEENPLIQKVITLRDRVIAHTDRGNLYKSPVENNPANSDLLTWGQVKSLIDKGFEILNRYSSLFDGSQYHQGAPGEDDYKSLLKHIRHSINNQFLP